MVHFVLFERWHLSQKEICQMTLRQIKNILNEGEDIKHIPLSREQQLRYVKEYRKQIVEK